MTEIEKFDDKDKIRGIFENGTKEEVDLLLAFETDPAVDEETRKMIKDVREALEKNHHHLGAIIDHGVTGKGGYQVGRTPNLSETEGDIE